MSVVNRLAIVRLGWSFGMKFGLFAGVNVGKEIEVLRLVKEQGRLMLALAE